MRIPRFWAVVEGTGKDPRGKRLRHQAWGWSMSSTADALSRAHEQLRTLVANVAYGPQRLGTYYPRIPPREPILDELIVDNEQAVVVTRNLYGAEILNTDRLLIADIDLLWFMDPKTWGWRAIFRPSTANDDRAEEQSVVVERLATLASWAAANPHLGVVVYRTTSGLRVFVTGVPAPTSSADGQRILDELGTDPVYRELCRTQGSYRARLTPKPWRLPRMRSPRDRWPFADERAAQRFERWLASYEDAASGFAVCRRLAVYGPPPSAIQARIIERHDERTRAFSSLPLA